VTDLQAMVVGVMAGSVRQLLGGMVKVELRVDGEGYYEPEFGVRAVTTPERLRVVVEVEEELDA